MEKVWYDKESGEQLNLLFDTEVTNDAILDESYAGLGARLRSDTMGELDVELFSEGADAHGNWCMTIYPLDGTDSPVDVVIMNSTGYELNDFAVRGIVHAAFSARAQKAVSQSES
jgi:hypothetical protein